MTPRRLAPFVWLTVLAGPLLVPCRSEAAWPSDAASGVPLCTSAYNQALTAIASDGAAGAIVVWTDRRSGGPGGIYAQHVLSNGNVDAAWPVDGLAVCAVPIEQNEAVIVGDGEGGGIVAWTATDTFLGGTDIYAQHVLANGQVDPDWPEFGRALCTATGGQSKPQIVADGEGGAIVAWSDSRVSGQATYAIRVRADGTVDPAWPTNGRSLCPASTDQANPRIVGDGAGGATAFWEDGRNRLNGNSGSDIYGQHVLSNGTLDANWPADGLGVCTPDENQVNPSVIGDGTGGAIVAWDDSRGGAGIYAQRVMAAGVVDPAWPAQGRALCVVLDTQGQRPEITSDGAGGAIVTWMDYRDLNLDIYAQRVGANGAIAAGWPANGRALCTASGWQMSPVLVSDPNGAGGAIVTWQDQRGGGAGDADIYAQHVFATGAVDPTWPANGSALCTATRFQNFPAIVANGLGGAIVAWTDFRTGTDTDIYAHRVQGNGQLGQELLAAPPVGGGGFTLEPVRPNPIASVGLRARFTLASAEAASLELIDAAGRVLDRRDVGPLGAGHHSVVLGEGMNLSPGLYFIHLRSRAGSRVERVAVLR